MRNLFASEKRCISNLFHMKWGGEFCCAPTVLSETIAEPPDPKKKPWFNCDFILHFVDWRTNKSERSAAVCSVLPNALGAELFLIVEKASLSPTALELNGGAAFPITHYASCIDVVEGAIQEVIERRGRRETEHPSKELMELIPIRKAAFARLLIVGSDATFLYFPTETTPLIRGQRLSLAQGDDREIDCYVDGGQIVCLDGWVRTQVTRTERMLVALPEENP